MNLKFAATGAVNLIAKRYAGPFWLRRRWLNKTQWLSRDELAEIQLRLLKRVIRNAYQYVPYYRDLMQKNRIRPDDIETFDDIKKLPILTKKDVLEAGITMVSTKYPRWLLRKAHTGGSTGTPLVVYRDLFSIGTEHAFVRRQWDWAGVGFRDRCAYLTGRLVAKPDQTENLYAYDPMMKELILSTCHLSRKTALDYLQAMKRYKVKAIVGYPSAVHFLARACEDSGFDIRLSAALTSSETLTEGMRETISKAFGCRVFDFYGSAERVCYIHTCEHGSYHLIPEYGISELIRANNGQYKLIATGFWNRAMPLIRYDTGDLVVPSKSKCPCGRSYPVIESIVGRETDIIRTPSGRVLGPTIVARIVKQADNILESQVVQDKADHLLLRYVPGMGFSKEDLSGLKNIVSGFLPDELHIDFERVESIEKTRTGKTRLIISQI